MKIGHVISKLRYEFGYSQIELAEKLGITKGSVGMNETDKRKPDYDTLIKLADLFHVSVDYLLSHSVDLKNDTPAVRNNVAMTNSSTQYLSISELYESMNEECQEILYAKAKELLREQRLEEKIDNMQY